MFKPGQPRPAGAGRQQGSLNKRSQEVQDKLKALGCDPIEGMAKIAIDLGNDVEIRAAMYKELAKYVAPQLKAIEVTTDGTIGNTFVQVTKEDIKAAFMLDPMLRKDDRPQIEDIRPQIRDVIDAEVKDEQKAQE